MTMCAFCGGYVDHPGGKCRRCHMKSMGTTPPFPEYERHIKENIEKDIKKNADKYVKDTEK
jgi:hypothetical protein